VKRLRPFFKYPGSKFILAPHYPKPKYKRICEPFAGSASYSTLYHDRDCVLIENDRDIAELWRYLILAHRSDVADLPYDLTIGSDIRTLDIPDGAKLLIRHWQRVGLSKCWTVSKWNAANTGFWCKETRDAIANQVEQINHWQIIENSSLPIIEEPTATNWTWFIDAPYQTLPLFGSKNFPYDQLGKAVQNLKGQAIVCEREGADWLPFVPFRKVVTGRRETGRYSAEVIFTQDKS
jgi:hypothetical protein